MLQTVDQVAEKLTISKASVWRYAARDPEFPKPIKLSPGCSRWRADEVDAWLETRERASA
ncbi:helix-turn-helix transcriptional regulator [Qipengyuania sp.]|uniref:helix-turn-helix transcriptional regulator n=1 Tax=Qipengyuania sp. TaxID=2004515 RepID=UPI003735FFDC